MDPKIWSDMFQLGVPILEKILRPVIVYLFLIVGLRLAGKRELAQLNPFDLVVLLTLSNTVQNAIIGEDNSVIGGLIGAATLFLINSLVVRLVFENQKLEKVVEGESDVLIENGKIIENRLEQELITRLDLEIAAHKQGFDSLEQVDKAILEPDGVISFTKKEPPVELMRHSELLEKLERIEKELSALRASQESKA